MRMVDLNLDVIRQAHAEDIKNYHLTSRPPPQHMHRHWLLAHVAKLEVQLKAAKEVMDEMSSSIDGYYVEPGHYSTPTHEAYEEKYEHKS